MARARVPGEFVEPYALAASGDLIAVWDKRPTLSVFRVDGSLVGASALTIGDTRAIWQRSPDLPWEEPLQLSREDVTRRLGALGGSRFGLLLQERDERFGDDLEAGVWIRLRYHLLAFDSTATLTDTTATLPGQRLTLLRPADERMYARPGESPFPHRPAWAAGEGWRATGHGSDTTITVRHADGRVVVIAWPRDTAPLDRRDSDAFIDFEIEAVRRTRSEEVIAQLDRIDRKRWIEAELEQWTDRPQLGFLLASGRCLALAGYHPGDGPLGDSRVILVLDVESWDARAVRLASRLPGFVRAFEGGALFRIGVTGNGERVVERFTVPMPACSGRRGQAPLDAAGRDHATVVDVPAGEIP